MRHDSITNCVAYVCILFKILPLFLHGSKTWSVTVREEHNIGPLEESAEDIIWTRKGETNKKDREKYITRLFITYSYAKYNYVDQIKENELTGKCEGKRPLGKPKQDVRITKRMDFKDVCACVCARARVCVCVCVCVGGGVRNEFICRVLVKRTINLQVQYEARNVLTNVAAVSF
jgi:hypothetical protein